MAAGTRTAGDVTGTPTVKRISWSMQGINDDKSVSHSYLISNLSTNVELEAFLDAIQALSTASMWEVRKTDVFSGVRSKSNATGDGRPSVDDKFFMTMKSVAQANTRQVIVPAPVSDIFDANSENIQTTDALVVALKTAADAIGAGYVGSWVSFTEYSETNEKQGL